MILDIKLSGGFIMKVALLSCTSKKKAYKCKASEMYSESPRFTLSYTYAKMTCDVVYILSAKYGLIPEDMEIEPYNETLNDKSTSERKEWSHNVLQKLENLFSLNEDEFLVLAGVKYNEFILPHLEKYELPLSGLSLGRWIPELESLIKTANSTNGSDCEILHHIFNGMPRLKWSDIKSLPFNNGIYIMFEKGEHYNELDRIVRVGTHRADNRLINRIQNHFVNENKDGSIFRKNIGRALLHRYNDPYEEIWELDTSSPEIKAKYEDKLNLEYKSQIEKQVTSYLQNNISFVCFQVESEAGRLRLEEGIISTLVHSEDFKSSSEWLGLHSPKESIAKSGLWNVQGLTGNPLTKDEIQWIQAQINHEYKGTQIMLQLNKDNKSSQEKRIKNPEPVDVLLKNVEAKAKVSTSEIEEFINEVLLKSKREGHEYVDIVSGDIHKQMHLNNKMPSVCNAMYKLKKENDVILNTTPSGKSSTIKIRYYL